MHYYYLNKFYFELFHVYKQRTSIYYVLVELGQLLPEKPGQNSGQANCGIFRLATVWCLLCESYTQLHHREKSYNSKLN